MIIVKIFYWLIFLALWIAVLKYRKTVYEWTGKFLWAEKWIGSWWTVIVIILFGLLLIFLSVAYPMWLIDLSNNQKDIKEFQDNRLK